MDGLEVETKQLFNLNVVNVLWRMMTGSRYCKAELITIMMATRFWTRLSVTIDSNRCLAQSTTTAWSWHSKVWCISPWKVVWFSYIIYCFSDYRPEGRQCNDTNEICKKGLKFVVGMNKSALWWSFLAIIRIHIHQTWQHWIKFELLYQLRKLFAEALIVIEAIHDVRESENFPRTYAPYFMTTRIFNSTMIWKSIYQLGRLSLANLQ